MSGFDMFSGDSSILPDDIKEYLGQHLEVGNVSTKWWSWLNVRWLICMFLKETYKTWLCILYVCRVAYDMYIYICLFIYVMFYRDHSCPFIAIVIN